MRRNERRELLKRLGPRYAKHVWAFQQEKCIYCGEAPGEIDHVPAISWLYALGSAYFEERGYPIITVPACRRCNGWLSDQPYHTIRQRKGYVASRMRQIFDKIMASPKWTDEEIEEMGKSFQVPLRERENIRQYGLRRLEWASSSLPWDLELPASTKSS